MKKVFKYDVLLGPNVVMMPKGAKILTFQTQDGAIYVWAMCDMKNINSPEERHLHVVGAGHEVPKECEHGYIGTTQQGILVWHLFEMNTK